MADVMSRGRMSHDFCVMSCDWSGISHSWYDAYRITWLV